MQEKFKQLYMDIASRTAMLSSARRLQVGAILVKDNQILSLGYNGTPSGWDNDCEYKEYDLSKDFEGNYFPGSRELYPYDDERGRYRLKTKPEVIHAESNCIAKVAKSTISTTGSTMFVTHAPCVECAKLIYQSGINTVYFGKQYRDDSGIKFLTKAGVSVNKLDAQQNSDTVR